MAGGYFDHDVVDSTNLEGSWDFDLERTPRAALQARGAAGISVFDAAEKQLVLKADLKNVEQTSLVIERGNRKRTETRAGVATALAVTAARFEAASIKHANPDQRPFQGLLYTGGSQMRAGGTLRFLIAADISPNIAGDLVVGLPKSSGLPAMGYYGQSAKHGRRRFQRGQRTADAAASQCWFKDAARTITRSVRAKDSYGNSRVHGIGAYAGQQQAKNDIRGRF